MLVRLPVLIEQPQPGVALAQLLDDSSQQALGVSAEQAASKLKRQLRREVKKHRISSLSTWKDVQLSLRSFLVQPVVFYNQRRYPAGPKVSLPVRCVELVDQRDQLYFMLPDFDELVFVPERKLLRTMLSETVRSRTAGLSPSVIQRLWPAASSEIRWLRLKLAKPLSLDSNSHTKALSIVAEPLAERRSLAVAAGSRDHQLDLLRDFVSKGSCLLVGEGGVGKSTLIRVVARELQVAGKQSESGAALSRSTQAADPMFWLSSGGRLIAGMRYLGQWQQRLEAVVAELGDINGVLVIENLLDLVTVGGSDPRDSLGAFLLPYIRAGSLRLVAEATPTELDACRRMLPALVDSLPVVDVPPMRPEHEVELLRITLANRLHSANIEFAPEIPAYLARLCRQFQRHRSPPGPAMSIIEELLGRRRLSHLPERWTVPWILEAFSKRTGLPKRLIDDSLTLAKEEVSRSLAKDVIGQSQACERMASVVTRIKSAVQDPRRPFGCLLFCGPTGVGKTQLAKSLADYLFGAAGHKSRLIRLDMSEYSGPSAGQRFLHNAEGKPAPWIQRIRSHPLSVLLLDEIEKASSEVFDVLLSVLDEGRLTDRLGRATSFRNCVILMTSNLGTTNSTTVGFSEERQVNYETAVRKAFKPEFFNRLDDVVAFLPLSSSVIRQITEKELNDLRSREGLERYGRQIRWTDGLVEYLSSRGIQSQLGARPLQQTIEAEVVAPLSRWLVENATEEGMQITLDWNSETKAVTVNDCLTKK